MNTGLTWGFGVWPMDGLGSRLSAKIGSMTRP